MLLTQGSDQARDPQKEFDVVTCDAPVTVSKERLAYR